jgi:hypothetical protein
VRASPVAKNGPIVLGSFQAGTALRDIEAAGPLGNWDRTRTLLSKNGSHKKEFFHPFFDLKRFYTPQTAGSSLQADLQPSGFLIASRRPCRRQPGKAGGTSPAFKSRDFKYLSI